MNDKTTGTEEATDFLTGLIVSNATKVTTAVKIPVLDKDLKLNSWIKPENLPPNKELLEGMKKQGRIIKKLKKRLDSFEK